MIGRRSGAEAPGGAPRSPRRLLRRLLADDTRSQKATLNVAASVLDYAARVVVGLLINPLLVSRLGDLIYGVYQSLSRLIGYATPAGGRPSQALKWTIARHQHSDRYDEKRLQVGSALAVWFAFLPPLLLAGGAIAWWSPILLGLDEDLYLTVRVAAGLFVVDLLLTNLLTIPQSVLQGENLGYKRMGLSMLVVLLGGVIMAVVVVAGGGIVGAAASVAGTTLLTGLLFLWVTRKNVPWFGALRPPLTQIKAFFKLSGWFLLWNLVMQLMRGSDVVVLGIAASPEDVTTYALARYVPEAIFGGIAIGISAVMPGLGGLLGARETGRAAGVRSESMSGTWLIATAAGAAFLVWQESFLGLWVGEQYYPGAIANLLIVVMVVQFAFIRNDASIIDLTLELRGKVLLGLVSALVSIALAVAFIRVWDLGISGLALGFISGRAIVGVAYPVSVCRALDLSLRSQLRGAARPLSVSAALFAVALLVAPGVDVHSWSVLVAGSAISFPAFAASAFYAGLSREQRRRLGRRLRQVVHPS
jgi:O-antigen/teichoic acid export membrane protein